MAVDVVQRCQHFSVRASVPSGIDSDRLVRYFAAPMNSPIG
jgi:hypothetical protein